MAATKAAGMSTGLSRPAKKRAGGGVVSAMKSRPAAGEGWMVPVGDIQPNPDNPASRSRPSESLVNSVRAVGVVQDLVLVPIELWLAEHPGREDELSSAPYMVLAGHQRLAAAKAVERDEVPARIREDFDATTLDSLVLHENLHRLALTPIEEGQAYRRIMERRSLSQRSLATHVGVSQSQISKKLRLLDLPDGLQAAVADGLVGIEESAVVFEEDSEVIAAVDDAITLASEGETVDLSQLVADARLLVRERHAREAAQQQADERKAPFVEAGDLPRALALGGNEAAGARRLQDDQQIAAAQESGSLVVAVSPIRPWGGGGAVEFYTSEKPKQPASASPSSPTQPARSDHHRGKANKARRAALREIVQTPPKTDVIRRELLAWAIAGGGWNSETCRIAQPLLVAAGLIEDGSSYWDILQDLPALNERQQYHATWILMIAHRDEQVGLPLHHRTWGRLHVDHYAWLADHGYEPGEWEQTMLDEATNAHGKEGSR